MADVVILRPCDADGVCMMCKQTPSPEQTLLCKTCATPWHGECLSSAARPQTMAATITWDCPDCSFTDPLPSDVGSSSNPNAGQSSSLVAAIQAIQADDSLTAQEKARKMQELHCGGSGATDEAKRGKDVMDAFDEHLICSICQELLERPVSTPCGHNFCLKCFQHMVRDGRKCANCRRQIPPKMVDNPRVNLAIVAAIRLAKTARLSSGNVEGRMPRVYQPVRNENRPDKAFTTERAKKAGKANACSGRIFVTVPEHHFGPIAAENDPERNQGVLVGETWEDRLECRQWGVHMHPVAGIVGQAARGAQSVVLSGGYEDDEDHGDWFLYTGSGGRDLSGNKRTNNQSFDQQFTLANEALRMSCRKGYPVRVVRSHKEKRSSYAPEKGLRYDGIYRIEKCWRKTGIEGFKVCRYLFVRCDNEPAPWASDSIGDRPRPLPVVEEFDEARDITERNASPSWDFDEDQACWMWKNPPPIGKARVAGEKPQGTRRKRTVKGQDLSAKVLKELGCEICGGEMCSPVTTPCGHNFCKACLESRFAGQSYIRERTCNGRRTLRSQKTIMKCPSCENDIAEFLQNPQVNRELMNAIETLRSRIEEEKKRKQGNDQASCGEGEDEGMVENEMTEGSEDENQEDTDDVEIAEGEGKQERKRKVKASSGGRKQKAKRVEAE